MEGESYRIQPEEKGEMKEKKREEERRDLRSLIPTSLSALKNGKGRTKEKKKRRDLRGGDRKRRRLGEEERRNREGFRFLIPRDGRAVTKKEKKKKDTRRKMSAIEGREGMTCPLYPSCRGEREAR